MSRDAAVLLVLGILLEISLLIMWNATKLDRTSSALELYFVIPFAIYLATVVWIMRSKKGAFYPSVVVVVLISIMMYATFMLQQAPTLSGDLYRYIWDGKLIDSGISPYRYPPDASQLAFLRDSNWQLVENKDIISPYPPLLELLNAITYKLSPTVLAFKALTVVFAFGSIIVLPFFLRKLHFDPRMSVVFAWNPLFILEFGSSAHDDTVSVFLVLVSFYLLTSKQRTSSALVMALAVVTKLFPLLIVPLLLKNWGIRATALFFALVISVYVPFALMGGSVLAPISQYVFTSTPIFNAGAFALFQSAFSNLGVSGSVFASRTVEYSIFVVVLAWMLWIVLRRDVEDIQLIRYSGILITIYIAFSSTVQPWYLSWIFVPFLVMMPTWSWIIFSGTIFLTYFTFTQQPLAPGYWAEITWVKVVEFGQLYSMIAYENFARRYFVPFRNRLAGEET